MPDSPPAFTQSSQSKKRPPLPPLSLPQNHGLCYTAFVRAAAILLLSFFVFYLVFPYHTVLSSHRITHVFWKHPPSEHHTNHSTENPIHSPTCRPPSSSFHSLTNPSPDLPTILRDYAAWHKAQRACLVDPQCHHKPKLLVLRCPHRYCLGLGDRMRGVPFSLFYAIVMKRLYIIAWPDDPFPLQAAFAPASIDWTPPVGFQVKSKWPYLRITYCCIRPECDCGQPQLTKSRDIDNNATQINFYTDDIEAMFRRHDVLSMTPYFGKRYYDKKNIPVNDILAGLKNVTEDLETMETAVFRTLFKPSKSVVHKMQSVSFATQGSYYGVHIRTGHDVNETDEKRFQYINKHMDSAIQSILDCLEVAGEKNPLGRVFLAADSITAKELFVEKAQKRGFNVKLFREEVIHYVKVNLEPELYDEYALCDRFLTLFADLYMLARSRIMVTTGSHFADFAHSLSGGSNSTHLRYKPELEGDPREICKLQKGVT